MIDISWAHLAVIAVVALIVIGPKELPTVLRTAGQWIGKIRRMASEFQSQFQEALREAEMTDLKQHFDDISSAAKDIPRFDPIATIRKEVEQVVADKPAAEPPTPGPDAPAAALDAPPAPPASPPPEPAAVSAPPPEAAAQGRSAGGRPE